MAEVVDAEVEPDAGGLDGGEPDAGAEGVAGDGCPVAGGEQQVTGLQAPGLDPVGELLDDDPPRGFRTPRSVSLPG